MWLSTKGTIKQCVTVLQYFQNVYFLVEVELCEIVHDIANICLFVFCVKSFGGIAAQPIFANEFILWLEKDMSSMASKFVEFRSPGGQSRMEQLNHSIFPSEELS